MRAEFVAMMQRQLSQKAFASGGKPQHDFAPVCAAGLAANQTTGFQAISKLYGAVVVDLKAVRNIPNSRPGACRESFNGEE